MEKTKEEQPPEETVYDRLRQRFDAVVLQVASDRLPGWEQLLERNDKARAETHERLDRLDRALRDEDEVIFTRALASWRAAWERINEILAEEYRAAHPDPKTWELRYVKWMKITFLRFGSKLGEFFLMPRTPRRKPTVPHWYTADEMIDMLHPASVAVIREFKTLPVRPDSFEPPGPGEHVMHIDLTGEKAVVKCDMYRRPRHGGKRVR